MESALHKAIPRCAKSRHTPTRSVMVSNAEVCESVLPLTYSMLLKIQSVMASTFEYTFSMCPNSLNASLCNLSDWQ